MTVGQKSWYRKLEGLFLEYLISCEVQDNLDINQNKPCGELR